MLPREQAPGSSIASAIVRVVRHGSGHVLIVSSVLFLFALLVGGGVWWVRALSATTGSIVLLVVVVLYRRFRRAAPSVPWACQVAAAVAVTLGVLNVITGVAHSAAVASLALKEPEYGPLQILRFTTGALLVYSGAMSIAVSRAIGAGRRWAIGTGVAAGLLFWLYLVFTLPLPGTGGTVPRELGLWTVYLVWLGVAAFVSRRGDRGTDADVAVTL